MKRLIATLAVGLVLNASPALASSATEAALAADPVAEKRLLGLSEELRCLVCQNQNIADSNAELAQDLRREIRGMIKDGKSDKEIIDFMVVRYGDFVLYRPPVKATTLLLWAGPRLPLWCFLIKVSNASSTPGCKPPKTVCSRKSRWSWFAASSCKRFGMKPSAPGWTRNWYWD